MKLSAIVTAAIFAFSSVNAAPAPTTTTTSGPLVNQFNIYKAGSFVNIDDNFNMPLETLMEVPAYGGTLRFLVQTASTVSSVQFYVRNSTQSTAQLLTTEYAPPYIISKDKPGLLPEWIPPQNQKFDVTAKVNYNNGQPPLTVTADLCTDTTPYVPNTKRCKSEVNVISNANYLPWRPRW